MSVTTREGQAAILLKSLPPQVAETVLAQLGEYGERVRAQMQALGGETAATEDVNRALSEFQAFLMSAAAAARPASEPPPPAPELEPEVEPPAPEPDAIADAVAALRELPLEKLVLAAQGESLYTLTLILNCLEATRAGDVMKLLPPEVRKDLSLRLGKPSPNNPDLLQTVARAVLKKCQQLTAGPEGNNADARVRRYADIIRRLERTDRIEILALLDQEDPETAAKLKELLYRFEDLALVEDRSMQRLLGEFDSKSLATSLKGAADAIKEKVMNNLSRRAREALGEEMEFLGNVPASQVLQAQKVIVEGMQRLDQAGELVMLES